MVPVLFYHKIDKPTPDVKIRGAFTAPARFAKQMSYLKRHGFNFLTASEMIRHYRQQGEFPARSISITFDDGWKDNYTHAFPVLKKLGIPATIFLVPSVIGQMSDKVVAEGENKREHLSANEIVEMSNGGIEFGSHSLNHVHLHKTSPEETHTEIYNSKKQIENLVQKPCEVFSYPAGFFTDEVEKMVEGAGYIGAFSTVYGDNDSVDLYSMNRIEILRRDSRPFQFGKKIKSIS
jgi:peptidoglycan/xylan/chitin deacetylase (PgdA/CDA1 family)